ncbi:hypothetical protein [Micromonospora costi]|uniref:Uncharacterized protein n=1 Tax=Micromonospora costi TaxID=1530042 RepID=A0A3B0A206_9ACTN|nr:hypothetical protein [Micromonospora costi]RKN54562.1 hypothetical protein D7193_21625 [Micromonospora costi]
MGEQAVTGPESTTAGMTADGSAAPGAVPGAGMNADGPPAATAAVPGAGMQADAESGTAGGGAGVAGTGVAGAPQSRTADIVPGPGGVMTDEVGVVTGELTLRSEYVDGQVRLTVQYKDADEWYAVTGGRAALADPAGLDAVHTIAVGLLNRPEG